MNPTLGLALILSLAAIGVFAGTLVTVAPNQVPLVVSTYMRPFLGKTNAQTARAYLQITNGASSSGSSTNSPWSFNGPDIFPNGWVGTTPNWVTTATNTIYPQ